MNYEKFLSLCQNTFEPINEFKKRSLPLCAAENELSEFVKIPLKTFVQDKYILGSAVNYCSDGNFIGSEHLFPIYNQLTILCSELFESKYADGRTLTGVNTINILLMSLFEYGDTILISSEECGGHSSMPKLCKRLGIKTIFLPYDYKNIDYNYDEINELLETNNIKGILICQSDILFQPRINNINLQDHHILIYDVTQLFGLIAAKKITNYLKYFDKNKQFILAGSTHKTLPGPTNGLILTNCKKVIDKIDLKINPDYLRNVQLHQLLSLIFTLEEFSIYGQDYMEHTVKLANLLGEKLENLGFKIVKKGTKYTETHQLFILMNKDITHLFLKKCHLYSITLNARYKKVYNGLGIRIGLQNIARYNWSEKEIDIIADILHKVYLECLNHNINYYDTITSNIEHLSHYKKICFTFSDDLVNQISKVFCISE